MSPESIIESIELNKLEPWEETIYLNNSLDTSPPQTTVQYLRTANKNLRCLYQLFSRIKWDNTQQQNTFLFIVLNCAKVIYGARIAYFIIKRINASLPNPLPSEQLMEIYMNSNPLTTGNTGCPSGAFPFTPDQIPIKLNIDYELAKSCGFYDSQIKKEQARMNACKKNLRDQFIIKAYYKGNKTGVILNELRKQGINISERTIRNTITKYELRKYKSYIEFLEDKENENVDKRHFATEKCSILYKQYCANLNNATSDEQEQILADLLQSDENSLILGSAGTGKSFLLNQFIEKTNTTVACCTYTGMASTNLKCAKTIHSLLNIPIRELYNDPNLVSAKPLFKSVNCLIIDEISMVRIDLFELILKIIHASEFEYGHKIRIILCGDTTQLQPFITKAEKSKFIESYGKSICFFESELFKRSHFKLYTLHYIHRQQDDVYKEMLNKVLFCDMNVLDILKQTLRRDESYDNIYICSTNKKVKSINDSHAKAYIEQNSHVKIRYYYTAEGRIALGKGMPVMITCNRNNYYHNGEYGTVLYCNSKFISIKLSNNRSVKVRPTDLNSSKPYFPLQRAYAITIHKCQGQTFKDHINIVCDSNIWSPSLLYVALSRATDKSHVHLLNGESLSPKLLKPDSSYHKCLLMLCNNNVIF